MNTKFEKIINNLCIKNYIDKGFSISKISRELHIDRQTVRKYANLNELEFSKLIYKNSNSKKKLSYLKNSIDVNR